MGRKRNKPAAGSTTRTSMAERCVAARPLRRAGAREAPSPWPPPPPYLWIAHDVDEGHDWFEAADHADAMIVARPLCLGYFDMAHVHAMTFAICHVEDGETIGTIELTASNVAPPR